MSGWYNLKAILQDISDEYEQLINEEPVACPNDGTPLLSGPHGELYCPFDGWRYEL